jgi:hypothetical protein
MEVMNHLVCGGGSKVEKPSQANMTRLLELGRCQTYMTLFEYAAGKSCNQIPSIKFML